MSIKLICFEPWQGNNIFEHDSGFGDRVTHWLSAYYLSTIIKNIQIIVQEYYWPELLLIDLPNTIPQDISSLSLSKNQLIPITFEELKSIILNEDGNFLDSSKDIYYYFNFSVLRVDELYSIFDIKNTTYNDIMHKAVSKIKLKLPVVSNFIEKEFSNSCCIHLRRGLGTFPTLKFLNEIEQFLPKETIDSYWKLFHASRLGNSKNSNEYKYYDSLLEKDTDIEEISSSTEKILYDDFLQWKPEKKLNFNWTNSYKIISDSDYFDLIDNVILIENPNQKIYISSDIPKKYYSYYYDRYPNNIIDKTYYLKQFITLHKNKLPQEKIKLKYSISILKTFENVFDLMVACHSEILVKSTSNWSHVSSMYKKKKVIYADRTVSMTKLGKWTFADYTDKIDFSDDFIYNEEDSQFDYEKRS